MGKDLQIGMLVTIIEWKEMLRSESGAAALVGQVTERATRGVMWMRGEVERYTVTVKAKEVSGFVSLNPIRSDVELIPQIKDGEWQILVKAKTEGDIVQNGTNLNPFDGRSKRKTAASTKVHMEK